MRAVKVGDYVLIRRRGYKGQDHAERVTRLTKTQIITASPSWGADGPTTEDRYRLASGDEISSSGWWSKSFIADDEPTQTQIDIFESNLLSAKRNWEVRSKADSFRKEITPALSSALGLPAEKFKLDWNFDKETEVSWNLEAKKLTQEDLVKMCSAVRTETV